MVINDKYPRVPDIGPDDLLGWNLGLSLSTSTLSKAVPPS